MTGSAFRHRVRLKYCAAIEMGQSPPSVQYSSSPEAGLPFLQGSADFGTENPSPRVYCEWPNKLARTGDILFSVRAPVGVLNLADQDVGIGRGLCAIRPGKRWDARFAWWALHESRRQLNHVSTGSTYAAVSVEDVGNLLVETNTLSRQRTIAAYLDQATARLDALAAEKERVVDLLVERREALISRAVTRGVDLEAALRESDIPWLGEIPKTWKTRRIAWLFRERDERGEPDLPLLEVSIDSGVSARTFSDDRIETTAADFNTYKIARRGDVVFNKMRMWQGAVGTASQDGLVSPDYVVAAPTGALLPQYANLLFRTDRFSAECARRSHGIVWDRLRLYWAGFRDITVPLPPVDTQRRIVEHVTEATTTIDALVRAARDAVALLSERRETLIAEAITGRIGFEGVG